MILKRWWVWVIQHHFKSQKLVKTMFQDQIMSINVLKTMSIAAPQNMVSPSDHEYQCAILYAIICHNINQPGTLRVTSSWSSSPSLSSACPGEKTKVAGRGCGSWRWSCWRRRPRRRQPLRWRPWWLGDGMGRMWKGYIYIHIYIYIYIYSIHICIKIAIETWETLGNLDGNKWEKLGVGMIGWVSRCIWASFDSMIWEDGMGNPNSHLMPLKVGNYDKLWQNIGMNMMYTIYIYNIPSMWIYIENYRLFHEGI